MPLAFLRRVCSEGLLYLCNHFIAHLPSHRLRLFFYRRVMGFEIGPGSRILLQAWFDCKLGLRLGRHSVINRNCRLDLRGGVEIGDNVSISAEVCILTADHDPQSPDFAPRAAPVRIEDYAFIGTRATILRGVTIGRGAVVAAGAVVTRSVEPYSIVGGCPARRIGTRTPDLRYTLSYGRLFQ